MIKRGIFLGIFLISFMVFSTTYADFSLREYREKQPKLQKGELPVQTRNVFRNNEVLVKFRGQDWFQRIPVPANSNVEEIISRFSRRSDILYIEPNYEARAFFVPDDTYYNYQWHLDNSTNRSIYMEDAWDISQGGGVVVAVVDTGVAYENHCEGPWYRQTCYYQAPDLANTSFVAGYDFVNNDSHPNDDEGHGTHVTGTIAQSTNNNVGVAGIAYKATIMPVKVLDYKGSGSYADVADGIKYAADKGAKIINLSLGGNSPSNTLRDAVEYAYNKGVLVVAAAGNDSAGTVSYPAAYDDFVLAVGATRFDKTKAPYSNWGSSLDIVAPGGDTTVDQNGDGYTDGVLQQTFGRRYNDWGYYFYQGTSMATPHVAGVAALVAANGNASGPEELAQALKESTEDLGASGWDSTYGYGLLNASKALEWTSGPIDNPPSILITTPLTGAVVSDTVDILVEVSDDNLVDRVEFYIDNGLIGSDNTNPYSFSWDTTLASEGIHEVKTVAFDNIGQSAQDVETVTIDNVNDPPQASAGEDKVLNDSDGDGFESVVLDGSGSFDPDGTIASYEWKEDTSILGVTQTLPYDFSVGTHTVELTVVDSKGASANDSVVINVVANTPPQTNAGPDKNAIANEMVNFDGSSSFDSDGAIIDYLWDFGDGNTGSGSAVSHSYNSTGDFTITLTVTDNGGLTNSDTTLAHISDAPSQITVFEDSFEFGLGQWVQDSQNDWRRSSQRSTDGAYSAEVDGFALDASLTTQPINLQSKDSATITFSWLIERSLDNGEYIAFLVSVDNGTTWAEKARLRGNVDAENVWHNENVVLSGISNVQLRFIGTMSQSNEDANVDNVIVVAE